MLKRLVIDNLVIHDLTPGVRTNFLLHEHPGLESPDIRTQTYDLPGEDGAAVPDSRYGGRLLSFLGTVHGQGPLTYTAARRALAYACRIQRDSYGLVSPTTIQLTDLDDNQYSVQGFIMPPYSSNSPNPTNAPFELHFKLERPGLLASTAASTGLVTRQTQGGAVFPLTDPITFTGGNPGAGYLMNSGNMEANPLIYFRGANTNPRIYWVEGQLAFQLNYTTTNATDEVVIDPWSHTVMLNGSQNVLRYRDGIDRSWLKTAVGQNTYIFTSGSAGDTGTMEVVAPPTVIGL